MKIKHKPTHIRHKVVKKQRPKYEVTNVLPHSMLKRFEERVQSHTRNDSQILDDRGHLIYSTVKYDLTQLFEKPPVFDEAPVRFKDSAEGKAFARL